MTRDDGSLQCDMDRECKQPITHIDNQGYIYCTEHGADRRYMRPCRKLRPYELRTLERGECVKRY